MACEDDNLMAPVLQSHSGIDHQPLGAANTKVRMKEDHCLLLPRRCRLCHPTLESWLNLASTCVLVSAWGRGHVSVLRELAKPRPTYAMAPDD